MSVDTITGPPNSVTNEEGHRWYIFGEGEQEERFISVTTALSVAGNKDGLIRWAAGLAATAAIDELPKLIKATRTKECGNTYKRCQHDFRQRCVTCPCGDCLTCMRKWVANRHYYESSRRAEEGRRVHDVAEYWVLNNGQVRPHDADIAVYVKQFEQWAADYGLTPDSWEMTEATVVSRQYGYAGTLDAIVTIHADATDLAAQLVAKVLVLPLSQVAGKSIRAIVDLKSREKEEARLYAEYALQQSGYRNAETVRLPDGREVPLPATDGALIVQLRPDGYTCLPVVADDTTFGAFLAALNYARWSFEFATASVSTRSFKVPKEPAAPKPAKTAKAAPAKRTPRKRATDIKDVPDPNPVAPSGKTLGAVAATQSATMRAVREWNNQPAKPVVPHPNSLYQDEVPF